MMSRKYRHKGPDRRSEPKAKNLAAAIIAAVMVLARAAQEIARQKSATRDSIRHLRLRRTGSSTGLALLASSG